MQQPPGPTVLLAGLGLTGSLPVAVCVLGLSGEPVSFPLALGGTDLIVALATGQFSEKTALGAARTGAAVGSHSFIPGSEQKSGDPWNGGNTYQKWGRGQVFAVLCGTEPISWAG